MGGNYLYGPGYYESWFIFVLPAVILAALAQMLIKTRYAKYSNISSGSSLSGAEVARMILDKNGLYDVRVEKVAGQLTDHYDPRTKVVRLSGAVYSGNSISSVSIAAHEVGHAIQDGEDYLPLRLRSNIAPIASIGSNLVWALIFLGFIFSSFFIEVAIALFLTVVLFQIVTLPVEFNASSRALYQLEDGIISSEKAMGAKKVLGAAAMTYVAATLTSIAELLRILSYTSRKRND